MGTFARTVFIYGAVEGLVIVEMERRPLTGLQ
jgi:hypothetical protein